MTVKTINVLGVIFRRENFNETLWQIIFEMEIIPKTRRLHPKTVRGEGVFPSKYLKAPDEVWTYSSIKASIIITPDNFTRFFVSIF
jgi:hypothetical protein